MHYDGHNGEYNAVYNDGYTGQKLFLYSRCLYIRISIFKCYFFANILQKAPFGDGKVIWLM